MDQWYAGLKRQVSFLSSFFKLSLDDHDQDLKDRMNSTSWTFDVSIQAMLLYYVAWQVGDNDDGMGEEEEEEQGQEQDEAGAAPEVEVEDMAGATFTGHSDAVYCVAVNPKNPAQVSSVVCRLSASIDGPISMVSVDLSH